MKNKPLQDIILYSAGTFLPALISFFSIPIMARYFTPEEYGINSLIDTGFNYANTIFFAILSSITWRFYNHFKNENRVIYYKNILYKLFVVNILLLLIIVFFVCQFLIHDSYLRLLLYTKYITVILAAYISIFSVILRLEGKSITYNLITIYGALFNFIILMFLTHKLKLRNVSLYLSQIIMQVFTVTFIFSRNRPKLFILESYKNDTQRDDILLMLKYGFISILAIFSQSLLASSDRYILKIFRNIAEVGIYDRVYNISDRIINLFVSLFLNIFTPLIYRKLDKTEWSFFKEIIPFFLVFIFPLFVYFTLFSEIITNMLLGDNYSSGFSIIPCICAGTVFFSLSSFSEMRIRFQKPILVLIGYIIANICNLVLNFIFIPYYGISGAAITTTLSYIVLFLFFSWKSFFLKIDFYFFRRKKSNIPYVLLVLQIGLHFIFQHFFYLEYLFFIIEALFFCITYYGLIFLLIFKKIITIPND